MASSTKNNNNVINWRDLPIKIHYQIKNISNAIKNKYDDSHILTLCDGRENIIKVWTTSSLLEYLYLLLGENFCRLKNENLKHFVISYGLKNCSGNRKYFSFGLNTDDLKMNRLISYRK